MWGSRVVCCSCSTYILHYNVYTSTIVPYKIKQHLKKFICCFFIVLSIIATHLLQQDLLENIYIIKSD